MTVFDSLILPSDEDHPACEHAGDEGAPVCDGWLCSCLRESYSSIPGAGSSATGLGSMGSCPVHTWY